jgi:hypothetical protein
MDPLREFLEDLKRRGWSKGNFLGLLYLLIGRRISRADGTLISSGLPWRDLAVWLKKIRWDPEQVRELGLDPNDLPPRDRQRYWYTAIARARVDSSAGAEAGEKLIESLKQIGYIVERGQK